MENEVITSMDTNFAETHLLTSQKTIKIYAINNNSLSLQSELPNNDEKSSITQAMFMGYGELILASTLNGYILIYKLENKTYSKIHEKKILDGSINSVAYQKKENDTFNIIAGCSDGDLCTLELNKDKLQDPNVFNDMSHKYGIVSISANDSFIASVGEDKTLKVSDGKKIIFEKKYEVEILDVSIAREDVFKGICFAICLENEVKIYNKRKDDDEFVEESIAGLTSPNAVKWSRAGYCLVVGVENGYKSFIPDDDGKFIEVEMEKIEQ